MTVRGCKGRATVGQVDGLVEVGGAARGDGVRAPKELLSWESKKKSKRRIESMDSMNLRIWQSIGISKE